MDLNTGLYDSAERLLFVLEDALHRWENLYGTSVSEKTPELRFMGVIRRAYERTGRRVVILVDEYDKPLLQAIGNPELQEKYRSVFSDLNNLDDLTMRAPYASLCGITEEELRTCFDEDIHTLSLALKQSYEETCATLALYYDGYHFTEDSVGVYNPFSLLNTFKYMRLGDYWFETGTPSYLVELLKRTHYDLYAMAHTETDADVLNSIDAASYNPIPVIYQSGYLTIKGYDSRFGLYRLGFPNKEVEEGFMRYLLPFYANVSATRSSFEVVRFVREIEAGDPDAFLERLRGFFADTPYELVRDQELHYQNVLFIVFKLVGFYVRAEYHTSNGRVDLVLQTDRYIYVMEFKLDGTAEEALRQIEEKGYARPFTLDSRKLFKIGVNFSSFTRTIDRWLVE